MTPEQITRRKMYHAVKYHTDPDFRQRVIERSRARTARLTAEYQKEKAERLSVVCGIIGQFRKRGYSYNRIAELSGVARGSLTRAVSGRSGSVDPQTEAKLIAAYERLGAHRDGSQHVR